MDLVCIAEGHRGERDQQVLLHLDADIHSKVKVLRDSRVNRDNRQNASGNENGRPDRSGNVVVRFPGVGQAAERCEPGEPLDGRWSVLRQIHLELCKRCQLRPQGACWVQYLRDPRHCLR